jgi:hypothetical protein
VGGKLWIIVDCVLIGVRAKKDAGLIVFDTFMKGGVERRFVKEK